MFPNNFWELEKFKHGGFFINSFKGDEVESEYVPVKLKDTVAYTLNVDGRDSHQIVDLVLNNIDKNEVLDKILLIRLEGILNSGKLSDIDFERINEEYSGAFVILRNSSKLKIKEFDEFEVDEESVEYVEEKFIGEHKSDLSEDVVKELFSVLDDEKLEGEKNFDFDARIIKNVFGVLNIDN